MFTGGDGCVETFFVWSGDGVSYWECIDGGDDDDDDDDWEECCEESSKWFDVWWDVHRF